jgi:hypothetical protein
MRSFTVATLICSAVKYGTIILSDQYPWSLPAYVPTLVWADEGSTEVHAISEATGS